jgi:mannose/fructose/N-acetylgalactosamine-specific phosphotransferase system component IIB
MKKPKSSSLIESMIAPISKNPTHRDILMQSVKTPQSMEELIELANQIKSIAVNIESSEIFI